MLCTRANYLAQFLSGSEKTDPPPNPKETFDFILITEVIILKEVSISIPWVSIFFDTKKKIVDLSDCLLF